MIYELHITVDHDAPEVPSAKIIRLELEHGEHCQQTLVSWQESWNDTESAVTWSEDCERLVKDLGYKVLRRKLEAPLSEFTTSFKYAEAHWKFKFDHFKDVMRFELLRGRTALMLSWSLDQPFTVWLTARYYGISAYAPMYIANCDRLIQREFAAPMHSEAVIVDSNLGLDEGWDNF